MKDTLDITQWAGKKQRLQTGIREECMRLSQRDELPFKLKMTQEQYDMLKRTPEFGDKSEWKYYQPKDRIYWTPWNCLEIVIK